MALDQSYIDYITDQFSEFEGVSPKKMFGGVGFFKEGLMFAMISSSNVFFLKVDENNKQDFEKAGMEPFDHPKKGKGMPYWTVPASVIEDKYELKEWAEKSFQASVNSKKK